MNRHDNDPTWQIMEAFINDPTEALLDGLLAREDMKASSLLARFASSTQFDERLFRRILEAGIGINTADIRHETALGQIIGDGSLTPPARLALIQDLLAAGADPNLVSGHQEYTACDWAVMRTTADNDLVGRLLPLSTPKSRLGMLLTAIQIVAYSQNYADGYPMVERMLALVDDVDVSGRKGFTPVHMAAVWADVHTLDLVLSKARKPELGLPAASEMIVHSATLPVKKGMNALAVVDKLAAVYAKDASKWKKMPSFVQALRATRIEHLSACRARLVEAGLTP